MIESLRSIADPEGDWFRPLEPALRWPLTSAAVTGALNVRAKSRLAGLATREAHGLVDAAAIDGETEEVADEADDLVLLLRLFRPFTYRLSSVILTSSRSMSVKGSPSLTLFPGFWAGCI